VKKNGSSAFRVYSEAFGTLGKIKEQNTNLIERVQIQRDEILSLKKELYENLKTRDAPIP
jgi:hypothetical protein